jgi:hypothetical protein
LENIQAGIRHALQNRKFRSTGVFFQGAIRIKPIGSKDTELTPRNVMVR